MNKYKLTKEFILVGDIKLFRIKALKDFGNIKKGDLGGYIEKLGNLSQYNNAWVYGDAKVFGNARVSGNALAYGDARVYGYAKVYGDARVCDARVYGHAKVFGNVRVYGNARVYDDAWVFDDAWVSGEARVCGEARVYGDTSVSGDAKVYGNAKVSHSIFLSSGNTKVDLTVNCNLKICIQNSLNLAFIKNKIIAFKKVNKTNKKNIFSSNYDPEFKYVVGKYAKVSLPQRYDKLISCGEGIHVSTANYWGMGDTLIAVEVDFKDIITCQEGKIRCKRVKVLGVCDE